MLPNRVRRAVGFTMWINCFFKLCPYMWDSSTYRLKKADFKHLFLHNIVFSTEVLVFVFALSRFIQMWSRGAEPRPFIMALIFVVSRFLEMTCFYQFHTKTEEIMYFANQLFSHLDQYRPISMFIFTL